MACGLVVQSRAATFPDRPLRYIVPFPPGGSTDIVARIVAAAMTEELGQTAVIDNRGGAGGTLVVNPAVPAKVVKDVGIVPK